MFKPVFKCVSLVLVSSFWMTESSGQLGSPDGRAINRLDHRMELGLYSSGGIPGLRSRNTKRLVERIKKLDSMRAPNQHGESVRIIEMAAKGEWIHQLLSQNSDEPTEDAQGRFRNRLEQRPRSGQQKVDDHDHSDHEHGDHNVPHHFQIEQIRALHESAERLEGVGLHELARELHRRAEEIEREIHRAQEHRPEQILMELMENMQMLRRDVREVNERLEQVMKRIDSNETKKRTSRD